jgi:carboxymethylenebutenolidase
VGYALAADPVLAAAIRTPSDGLVEGDVRIPVDDAAGTIAAYYARPEGAAASPVVLVIHEIFGVHEYIRDVCRRLAHEGYFAVAPDLFQRQGDVSKLSTVREIIDRVVRKVPDAQVLRDLDATLAWARSREADPELAFTLGFCWGGRIVWLVAAHRPDLTAGAAFYGRLEGERDDLHPRQPIDLAAGKMSPVVGLYGGEDPGIPLEQVWNMRKKLAEAEQISEILIFPTASHGFHADYRSSYRELPAREAWRRTLAWYERFTRDAAEG